MRTAGHVQDERAGRMAHVALPMPSALASRALLRRGRAIPRLQLDPRLRNLFDFDDWRPEIHPQSTRTAVRLARMRVTWRAAAP
jgi:hypothetical protein